MKPECRLYLLSPPQLVLAEFLPRLEEALATGLVPVFQLRMKGMEGLDLQRIVSETQRLCRAHDAAFVVNDAPSLAAEVGADGVHVGQEDLVAAGGMQRLREVVGPEMVIGISCHDSRHLAMEAGEQGADYVSFGAFYPTRTKDAKGRPQPEILSWWNDYATLPSVAIGGITPANVAPLVTAGADFLAVVSYVWEHAEGPGREDKKECNSA